MAFSKRSGFGISVVLLAAGLFALGCDDGGSGSDSNGGGSTGGSPGATGGGNGTGDGVEGTVIFDGTGTWVDGSGPAGEYNIQGAFFVLEDSVENGSPVSDGLTHTDLTPDSFDESTAKPCVSGTVAQVTNADGGECDPAGSDCQWSAQWGGGIGLNLNETGGEASTQSPTDLVAAGVKGFSFRISGDVGGATLRFKIKDAANNAEDFCTSIVPNSVNTVLISELKHQCWGSAGTLSVDATQATQLQWQIVTSASASYTVSNFCIEEIAVVTE